MWGEERLHPRGPRVAGLADQHELDARAQHGRESLRVGVGVRVRVRVRVRVSVHMHMHEHMHEHGHVPEGRTAR